MPATAPTAQDWLGVPMRREDRVCGAIVVQSYDQPARYSDEDRALLAYVAQHILTALDRKHAQAELERRVDERTQELQQANPSCRPRSSSASAPRRCSARCSASPSCRSPPDSLERFYADVHAVVGELLYARNFYIALLSDDGERARVPVLDRRARPPCANRASCPRA